MIKFRFQDFQIWQLSIQVSDQLFDIADVVEEKRYFKFSDQLRGAVLSISNNIAEGSGSYSKKDFAHFLNMSRRSIFEVVNILIIFERGKFINKTKLNDYLGKLDELSRKISSFRKAISVEHGTQIK